MPITFNCENWKIIGYCCELWFLPSASLQSFGEKKLHPCSPRFSSWFYKEVHHILFLYNCFFWHMYTRFWLLLVLNYTLGLGTHPVSLVPSIVLRTWTVKCWIQFVKFLFLLLRQDTCVDSASSLRESKQPEGLESKQGMDQILNFIWLLPIVNFQFENSPRFTEREMEYPICPWACLLSYWVAWVLCGWLQLPPERFYHLEWFLF